MSNISKNKDIDGNNAEEARSSEVDQILDVDASILQTDRSTIEETENMDPKLNNIRKLQSGKTMIWFIKIIVYFVYYNI